ncbi:MAG: hypothetical protein OQK73_11940 [Gammaproteobacteria bacterium]|nr:hypothetical protein [Gammaproteobacteria bacterium]
MPQAKAKAKAKAKKVVKNDAIEKSINVVMSTLSDAGVDCEKSILVCTKDAKSNLAASKRLSKKRAALSKRKRTTAARLKKTPNAENRKAAKAVEKELAAVKKEIDKLTPIKSANAAELAALKVTSRRINAYAGVLERADRVLNKPKKKRRKKRAAKKAA